MSTVAELILEALQETQGSTSINQIYSYVNKELGSQEKALKDYKHTVRGILYRLVKTGKVLKSEKIGFYRLA